MAVQTTRASSRRQRRAKRRSPQARRRPKSGRPLYSATSVHGVCLMATGSREPWSRAAASSAGLHSGLPFTASNMKNRTATTAPPTLSRQQPHRPQFELSTGAYDLRCPPVKLRETPRARRLMCLSWSRSWIGCPWWSVSKMWTETLSEWRNVNWNGTY